MTILDRIKHRLCILFDEGDLPRLGAVCDQLNEIAAHGCILRTILEDSLKQDEEPLEMAQEDADGHVGSPRNDDQVSTHR